ncbi:hypothetical protein [Methyloceanibacter sp.]|uniref:hypothetical protein n=1 Tax=Methyloceanibacter sp. TaxID=1965321 RepID=UPI003D6D0C83
MKGYVILGVIATLLLLGCDSSSTRSSSTDASTSAPVSEVSEGVTFKVDPETLRECDPPAVVTLTWDASAAGASAVKIFVVGEDGNQNLFAFLGAQGTEKTGAWAKAKEVFILKDENEKQQLAKFVVGSEKCK